MGEITQMFFGSSFHQETPFEKYNEVCEQLTFLTDMFSTIIVECPDAIRKDVCECVLYFCHLVSERIKTII